MKQHNKYNDEELYQQIMAELKPGADEYDKILEHKRHKNIGTFGYLKWATGIAAVAVVGYFAFPRQEKSHDDIATVKPELKDTTCTKHEVYPTSNPSLAKTEKEQHPRSHPNAEEANSIDILPEVEMSEYQEMLDEITVSPRLHHDLPYIIDELTNQFETNTVSLGQIQVEADSETSAQPTENTLNNQ